MKYLLLFVIVLNDLYLPFFFNLELSVKFLSLLLTNLLHVFNILSQIFSQYSCCELVSFLFIKIFIIFCEHFENLQFLFVFLSDIFLIIVVILYKYNDKSIQKFNFEIGFFILVSLTICLILKFDFRYLNTTSLVHLLLYK